METQSGSLYHKESEQPPPQSWVARWLARRRAPGSSRATTSESIWPTIRMLIIVLGIMGLVLSVATRMSRTSWERKVRAARQSTAAPTPTPAIRPLPAGTGLEASGLPATRGQGAADAAEIRKAVFLAEQGREFQAGGNDAQAVKMFREALATWPHLAEVWTELGRAYLRLKNFEEARQALNRAVDQNPGDASLHNDLGVALLLVHRPDDAVEHFREVLSLDPAFATAHYNLALCHLARKEAELAREQMETYLELQPHNARALREVAYLDATQGDYAQALVRITAAREVAPDWADLYLDTAAALALLERHAEAITFLEQAEELMSAQAVARHLQLPAFEELLNDPDGAAYALAARERAARAPATAAAEPAARPSGAPMVSPDAAPPAAGDTE